MSPNIFDTAQAVTSGVYTTGERLEKLLSGCRINCRSSQKELYSCYYGYAMSIALRYSSNHDNAVEMVNDAFLKIFTQITCFIPRYGNTIASFMAWVRRIVTYSCIDHFRKYHKNAATTSIELDPQLISAGAETAENILQHKEIIRCIQQLSRAYRAVFNLYVIEGFSHAEIAASLQISEGASKSNLHKAKQKLQQLLRKRNIVDYESSLTE